MTSETKQKIQKPNFKIYLDGTSSGIVRTKAPVSSHALVYAKFSEAKKALRDMVASHIDEYMIFRRRVNAMKLKDVEYDLPKYITD